MKKVLWLPILIPLLAQGEVRLPSGEREERAGVVSVKMGFGSVSFPAVDAARSSSEKTVPGKKLACNRGVFSLRYDLVRDGSRTKVRRVSVSVKNQAEYIAPKDRRLEEHERGHQRINEAAAGRLEAVLGPDMRLAVRSSAIGENVRSI